MEQSDLIVRRIKDGTVIDHINEGKGLKVLDALEIDGSRGNVITIALNMPSGKLKKKDMIKVEGEWKEAGDYDFPWEEDANNGNENGTV